MLIFVQKLEPGVINKIKYRHNTAAKPYSILCPYVTFTHISYNIKLAMKKERQYQQHYRERPCHCSLEMGGHCRGEFFQAWSFIGFTSPFLSRYASCNWRRVGLLSGSLSSGRPAPFGLFACLDFGPCPLFLFLSHSWVLSLYRVWNLRKIKSVTREVVGHEMKCPNLTHYK